MLAAIEGLPDAEREAFDMVRIQGMGQTEAARILGVWIMTVKRRLNRGLQLLAANLGDLRPSENEGDASYLDRSVTPAERPNHDRR